MKIIYKTLLGLSFLGAITLTSCKKDDITNSNTDNTATVEEAPFGKTFPARQCSYFPANENGHYWKYNGPSYTYTTETTGIEKTIDGESWYELHTKLYGDTSKSYYRYEDGKYIVQFPSAFEGKNYDLPLINLTKKVGEKWDGPTLKSNSWTQNKYNFELVDKGISLEVLGVKHENVLAVMLTTQTFTNIWTDDYELYSTIEQIAYYAKGVGFISQTSDYSSVEVDLIDSDLIDNPVSKESLSESLTSISRNQNITIEMNGIIPIVKVEKD